LRTAGDEFDSAIVNYVRRVHGLAIGDRTAEDIKINLGCAFEPDESIQQSVRGRDLVSGLPRTVIMTEVEAKQALSEALEKVIDAIRFTLEKTPPELASDIMGSGIMLAGGGAQLKRLDQLITHETGLPVHIADEPLNCVVAGTGIVLENMKQLTNVLITPSKIRL